MSVIQEKALFFDTAILKKDQATKQNILGILKSDGVVSLKDGKNEFYLIDIHVINSLHSSGQLPSITKTFINAFSRKFKDNNLKASSSQDDNFIPAGEYNYALIDKFMKPVGDMLYFTLDDVSKAIGKDFLVNESAFNRILAGEDIREALK